MGSDHEIAGLLWMARKQNGGCLKFLSGINYPSFFLGCKRFQGVHSTSQIKMVTLKEAL